MIAQFTTFINYHGGVMIHSYCSFSTLSSLRGRLGGGLTEAMKILLFIALFFTTHEFADAQYLQIGTKLVGTGAVGAANQGGSVSLSADGNTAIVGGGSDNSGAGAAWVYTRAGSVWTQQGTKLVGTGGTAIANQGVSVYLSADGNTAIMGGPGDNLSAGAAWVFTRSGGVWTQQGTKLVGGGAVGNANQGYAVAVSADGNTAIVGGSGDNSAAGAAWVFTRSGGVWTQQGTKLIGTGAVDPAHQGQSVSLSADGNTAFVGGPNDNSSAGAAWVFTRTGGVWSQQGMKLVGTGAMGSASQGTSVYLSADGNTAFVGGSGDNNGAGAGWVFTRAGGVWTQQGTKLVGTGAVGFASQGASVSLSADGNTAIVGGVTDNSGVGAAWMYVSGQPRVASVKDVLQDQGGYVFVNWNKSPGDVPQVATVTSYWVWRGVRASALLQGADVLSRDEYVQRISEWRSTKRGGNTPTSMAQTFMTTVIPGGTSAFSGDIYWQYITSLPSHGLQNYSYASSTLADSTADGIPWRYFFITAATNDPAVYWDSRVDSGYSVDNLPPATVASIAAQVQPGPSVKVHWGKDIVDPDVGYYEAHRSTTNGFTPSASTKIGQTADTSLVDGSPVAGTINYYKVLTVDIHGNKSISSAQAAAAISTTAQYSVMNTWNMVSVPLTVSDYTKTNLYPTAVSNAFAYQGSYLIKSTLANGEGYWLRFNGNQTVSMTGLLRTMDTINVVDGWNMVGSISAPVAVTSIGSSPGGIRTSNFFGYAGGYSVASTIEPGKAYWVKVNQSGKLILASSSSVVSASDRIRVVPTGEQPPAAPDDNEATRAIPSSYALDQNYPNPFNPSTIITYALSQPSKVRLSIFNTLGQEVLTLINQFEDAGYKSVSFDASQLPSSVYYYRLQAGNFTQVKKMLLTK